MTSDDEELNDSHESELDGDDNASLGALIARAVPPEAPDFHRPPADTIDAYLLGYSTEGQRQEVLQALARSRSFRAEIAEAATALLELADEEAARRIELAPAPEVPDWKSFRDSHARGRASRGNLEASIWSRLVDAFRARPVGLSFALGLAVAAILVVRTVMQPAGRPGAVGTVRVAAELHPTQFLHGVTRGDGDGDSAPGLGRDETLAAVRGFTDGLVYHEGRWGEHRLPSGKSSATRDVRITVLEAGDRELGTYRATADGDAAKIRGWLLGIPSLKLERFRFSESAARVRWAAETDSSVAVLVTFETPSGFQSSEPRIMSRTR